MQGRVGVKVILIKLCYILSDEIQELLGNINAFFQALSEDLFSQNNIRSLVTNVRPVIDF